MVRSLWGTSAGWGRHSLVEETLRQPETLISQEGGRFIARCSKTPTVGDLEGNAARIAEAVAEA